MTNTESRPRLTLPRIPWWAGAILLAAIAVFFLWEEHKAHILGALPWLLLLACPLIHMSMHGRHGQGHGDASGSGRRPDGSDGSSHQHGGAA